MGSSIVPFNFKAVFYDKLCSRFPRIDRRLQERHRDCYFDISLFKDFTPQVLSLRIYGTLNPLYPSKKISAKN